MSFAGLADLVEGAGPAVLAGLPVPQRHALEVAVRRAEPEGAPPEPLAIAAGLLGALRVAAGAGPVLVAVDDLPWLDGASAAALGFAARRPAHRAGAGGRAGRGDPGGAGAAEFRGGQRAAGRPARRAAAAPGGPAGVPGLGGQSAVRRGD